MPTWIENEAFRIVEAAAVAGERCPTNDQMPDGMQTVIGRLARAGRVRIEVYGRNWRVVEILTGPNKGKRTQEHPTPGARPYRILPPPRPVTMPQVGA